MLIADPRGGLEVVAASDERTRFVELLQGHTGEGPCVECIAGNTMVASVRIDTDQDRWPRFAAAVTKAGFASVYAFPMRLTERAVGLISGALSLPADEARALLSAHTTATGRSLRELAQAITGGTLSPHDVHRNSARSPGHD